MGGLEDSAEGALLALLVNVELVAGAVEATGKRVDRLSILARNQSAPYLFALTALARGKLCVVTGTGDARATRRRCGDCSPHSPGTTRV